MALELITNQAYRDAVSVSVTEEVPYYSAAFNSSNSEYLSVASNSALQQGDFDWYCYALVYLDSKGANRPIMTKWSGSSGKYEYYLYYQGGGDVFRFFVYDGVSVSTSVPASTFGSPTADTWYLVVAHHSATDNQIGIQVDNGTVDTAPHSTGVTTTDQTLFLGRNDSEYMNGRIAAAGIAEATLTTAMRSQLYNDGYGVRFENMPAQLRSGLRAFWQLEESSGTRADSLGVSDLSDGNTVTRESGPNSSPVERMTGEDGVLSVVGGPRHLTKVISNDDSGNEGRAIAYRNQQQKISADRLIITDFDGYDNKSVVIREESTKTEVFSTDTFSETLIGPNSTDWLHEFSSAVTDNKGLSVTLGLGLNDTTPFTKTFGKVYFGEALELPVLSVGTPIREPLDRKATFQIGQQIYKAEERLIIQITNVSDSMLDSINARVSLDGEYKEPFFLHDSSGTLWSEKLLHCILSAAPAVKNFNDFHSIALDCLVLRYY